MARKRKGKEKGGERGFKGRKILLLLKGGGCMGVNEKLAVGQSNWWIVGGKSWRRLGIRKKKCQ